MKLLTDIGQTPSIIYPARAPGLARQSVRVADDGPELCVELSTGALGQVGHDRLGWGRSVQPSLALGLDALADRARRRRGDDLARIVELQAAGMATLTIHRADDCLLVAVWVAPVMWRWARRKRLDVTALWSLLVSRIFWVRGEDGEVHPAWAALSGLDWSEFGGVIR